MRRVIARTGLLIGLALAGWGCGPSNTSTLPATVTATHNGTVLPLPEGQGYVELLVESDKPNATGKGVKGRVVAYFLNKDGNGPVSPAPTDVTYLFDGGKSYTMTPLAGSVGGFQTEAGPFPPGRELSGELSATLDGKPVKVTVATR